jgi:hypothetical protein
MRIRNPQYAPELLERKLSPSSLVATPAPAPAYVVATDTPPYPPGDPTLPTDPNAPVLPYPGTPAGPSGPA